MARNAEPNLEPGKPHPVDPIRVVLIGGAGVQGEYVQQSRLKPLRQG